MSPTEAQLSHAISKDGTAIGYWTSGRGRPLVVVHGTGSLHTTWNMMRPFVERWATIHAVDRRGRGASGDGPVYRMEREFEDVAAVVEAVTEASGEAVDLLGHSFGGLCAFGAAGLTSRIRRLVLYEGWPGMGGDAVDPEMAAALEGMLDQDDRHSLLETFLLRVVKIGDDGLQAVRAIPGWWETRVAVVHTIPREYRVVIPFDPVQAAATTVPTMIMVGDSSPPELSAGYEQLAAALPDARVVFLEGQQHRAHLSAPEAFADHLASFLR